MREQHARPILPALVLLAVTWAAYAPVLRNGFTTYDDDQYVTANAHVQQGLTIAGLRWAFASTTAANWHPLTWLSHMADCAVFGLDARGHHATSVVIHGVTAALLLLVLAAMTGQVARSFLVAALFGLHPLRVESVAWIAERKDVLSGLFFVLVLAAYRWYARKPSFARYVLVAALFAAGLLAKPMLVTVPFVLLLLDLWPLERRERPGRLVLEKLPLVVLSIGSAVVTLVAQRSGGALATVEQVPVPLRIANALVTCVVYLKRSFLPTGLAAIYPYPDRPWGAAALAAVLLAAISVVVVRERARRPYLLVGWLWYLGMLVPVLGLVQVGEQPSADRYTYLPSIGILLALVWGSAELLRRAPRARGAMPIAVALLALLAGRTWVQAGVWRDSITLFEHALAVGESASAHENLAIALQHEGKLDDAERHYTRALELDGARVVAHNNLGSVLSLRGRWEEAEGHYREALRLDPRYADAHDNLGVCLARAGRYEQAEAEFAAAVGAGRENARYFLNWGTALVGMRRWPDAIERFREALAIEPDSAAAHFHLSAALYYAGDLEGARREADIAGRAGYVPPREFLEMLPPDER